MIQSIALFTLCLTTQFDFGATSRPVRKSQVTKQVETKIQPELVAIAQRGDGDPSSTTIAVTSIAVPRVKLEFFRVDTRSKITELAFSPSRVPKVAGKPIRALYVTAPASAKRSGAVFNFRKNVKVSNLPTGYYVLRATGSGASYQSLVPITNLNVLTKRGRKKTLVWVTNFATGKVTPSAKIEVFDNEGRPVSTAKTSNDGIAFIPTSEAKSKSRAILVGSGRDQTILLQNAPYERESTGHIQTDRPIYRPGNEVQFKGFFRDPSASGYKTPVGKRVDFELRDPEDEVLQRGTLTTNSFGSVAGSVAIPADGTLGAYSLVLTYNKQSFYSAISCLAYRKPQFKVSTSSTQTFFAGDKASLQVKAEYLFAAPLPNANIAYTVRRVKRSSSPRTVDVFDDPGQENLTFADVFNGDEFVASGYALTDREGIANIVFQTAKDGLDSRYKVSLTVTDATNRQVESQGAVYVPAAAVKLDVDTNVQSVALGEQIPLTLKTSNTEGKPIAASGVLTATRQVWNDKLGRDTTEVLLRKEVQIPNSGRVTVNTLASRQGRIDYAFEVKDSQGRVARVETEIDVFGPIPFEEKEFTPTLLTAMSKRRLKVGEKATVLVTTNVRKGPILFTIEGNDLEDARVFQPSAKGIKVPITATKAMQPGATLIATQSTRFDFLTDQTVVDIPATDEKLTVRVTPKTKAVRPGEKTTLMVETLDAAGNPTAAELSLKIIDAAIYQIAEENVLDPFKLLWGPRSNQVETTYSSARELSGGAFQMAAYYDGNKVASPSSPIRVRRNFQDTAYWNAFVTTGKDGKADLEVTIPDNLTTWRATAVGITTDSQAGMNSNSFVATQPFTLRIATPRQIVAGDKLDLTASINNRTDLPSKLNVSLEVDVDGQRSRFDSTVSVSAKGEETFVFPVTVPQELRKLGAKVVIRGEAKQVDGPEGDAVEEVFPMVPGGVSRRVLSSGAFENTIVLQPELPSNRLTGLDDFRLTIWAGVMPVVLESTQGDFDAPGWNPPTLAMQIESLARLPKSAQRSLLPTLFSRLSATKSGNGWGWWPESKGEAEVTTEVAYAIGTAQRLGVSVPERLKPYTSSVLRSVLDESGTPEAKALVLSSIAILEPGHIGAVVEFSKDLSEVSPYARARVAEALLLNGKTAEAQAILSSLKPFVSDSGGRAFLPGGVGLGWSAGSTETTAQYLHALCLAKADKPLRTRLAQWLLGKAKETYGSRPKAAMIRGLTSYEQSSPSASELGEVRVSVNGSPLEGVVRPSGAIILSGKLPASNAQVAIQSGAKGEVFYALESRYFDNTNTESPSGIRVLRRFEVMNEAGQWEELKRAVRVNEPVRVSVVAWSDGLSEPIRITEPIPAGFEYADGDTSSWAYEEVRDGAVVHTLVVGDQPLFFRYYLRAESPGTVLALPAIMEVLRRGDAAGQSSASLLKIQSVPKNP